MNIETLIWRAGTNRGVSIGESCFSGPTTFLTYNDSTYTVPLIGETFTNSVEDYTYTIATGSGGTSNFYIEGSFTTTNVIDINSYITDIVNINFGTSVTSIGIAAIKDNTTLKTVDFRDSENSLCTNLEDNCFRNVNSLQSINLTNNITNIGEIVFYQSSGLSIFNIPTSLTYLGRFSFRYTDIRGPVIFPDSLISTGTECFREETNITSITLGNGMEVINDSMFFLCTGLTGLLQIPDVVTKVNKSSFRGCTGLSEGISIGTLLTTVESTGFFDIVFKSIEWFSGNARNVTFGSNAFSDSVGFGSTYNNSSYDVPLDGKIFF
jgi:hypothetical protein